MKFLSFAHIVGFGLVLSAIAGQASSSFEQIIMQTGQFVSGMESYDRIISQLMHEHGIPGAVSDAGSLPASGSSQQVHPAAR